MPTIQSRPAARTATTSTAASTPAKKPATTTSQATVTAPGGWKAPVAPALPKFIGARFSIEQAGGLMAPKGMKLTSKTEKHTDTVKLTGGKTAKLEWTNQTLTVKNAAGKTVTLKSPPPQAYAEAQKEFRSAFKGLTKDELEFEPLTWEKQHSYGGFGAAGKMVSVRDYFGEYTGGAHPNGFTFLTTFNTETGKPVKLSELLSKPQIAAIAAALVKEQPKMKSEDGIDATMFAFDDVSTKSMTDFIDRSFALTTDSKGNPQIEIAWESGMYALGGTMARFTFAAPNDPAFRAKIGLK
ncbi:MAG: hypothetical protein JNG84_00245 [Archangium sp.]|nr:hypothetical protein [Archangium sp.]